ncbi:hypothetical protein BT93_J1128 [Corymbia citriodora subsp. variegata]|nr:hypothetical protein BT93_J1128 [Corymbia citriodora subsp. variegata]
MEEHKLRARHRFLQRSRMSFKDFMNSLRKVELELKDSYNALNLKGKEGMDDQFLELMIMDGCFMLEIMRTATGKENGYAPNDPIFSTHSYITPYIRRDMLMLENQLPMLVLYQLVAAYDGKEDQHKIIRSATELDMAGIRFKTSKTNSLKDISFAGGKLKLPVIMVDDAFKSNFLNLMTFERLHIGAGTGVTSYVVFMDDIINDKRDVALLHAEGIIQNSIGSNEAVAELFNSLCKEVTLVSSSSLETVQNKISEHCEKPWNKWRANLNRTYFKNPWTILSLSAAIFLFALTIIQTVYALLDYY